MPGQLTAEGSHPLGRHALSLNAIANRCVHRSLPHSDPHWPGPQFEVEQLGLSASALQQTFLLCANATAAPPTSIQSKILQKVMGLGLICASYHVQVALAVTRGCEESSLAH